MSQAARVVRPWLVLVAIVCSIDAAHAEPREEAVRFQYAAPEDCPNAEDFTARVRARTARGRSAEPEELARTFTVTIEPEARGFVGSIEFLDEAGARVSRRVSGEQCEAVASGLALITALALDATLREDEARPAPSPPSRLRPPPPPRPPAPAVAPSVVRRLPQQSSPPLSSMRVGLSGGYAGAERAPRLGLLGQLDFRSGWSLRLTAHYAWDQFVADDQGRRARLRAEGVEATVCPWQWASRELAVVPCALLDGGWLRVGGVKDDKLTTARSSTIWWGTVGAQLRLAWEPRAAFWAEARAEGLLPLRQGYRFTFENPHKTAYEVPAFAVSAGLSGGVRFW